MLENEPSFLARPGCDTAGTTPGAGRWEARRETPAGQVMQRETPGRSSLLTPLEYHRLVRDRPTAARYQFGWVGLDAERYRDGPDGEVDPPAMTHHTLIIFHRPPDEMDVRYEEVKRHLPPPRRISHGRAGRRRRRVGPGRARRVHPDNHHQRGE